MRMHQTGPMTEVCWDACQLIAQQTLRLKLVTQPRPEAGSTAFTEDGFACRTEGYVVDSGRFTAKVEPLRCSETTEMSPPWLCTIESTMVSPSPVP